MGQEREIDEFVRAVCATHPELRDGRLEAYLGEIREAMLGISLITASSGVLNAQRGVVKELRAALQRLGARESAIQWGTTSAMVMAPGVLGALSSLAVGTAAREALIQQREHGQEAVTGPMDLCDKLEIVFQTTFSENGERADKILKTLDQIEAVVQTILCHAKASGWSVHKEPIFGYEQVRKVIEQRIEEESGRFKASLTDAAAQCNNSASEILKEHARQANITVAAGAAALAFLASSAAGSPHNAPREETEADRQERLKKESPLHNPFWHHG